MTLFGTILKKVRSQDSISKKYSSPPPETTGVVLPKKKKKYVDKFKHVRARVDSSSPQLQTSRVYQHIDRWCVQLCKIYWQNVQLLTAIKRQHFLRGKLDSHWDHPQYPCLQSYHKRKMFLRRVETDNKHLYQTIVNTKARVTTTESMQRDWVHNRLLIIRGAEKQFVLFEPEPQEEMEDIAFTPPDGVKRPRVYIQLGLVGAALMGELVVELFTDVCPLTCRLFLELLDGDGLGHGYVGTYFFTKVPNLYWAGGDVIHNNGFGCYAQRGRQAPIGAENYHFSHSIPGLLSMRMTRNDEMCGIFNITFKALPQFDLRNVVFGRVIRPSSTYDAIRQLGSPLSTQPVVSVTRTRRLDDSGRNVYGQPNTQLKRHHISRRTSTAEHRPPP